MLLDVSNWRVDDEHGVFPRGARDKKMIWSPENPPIGVRSNWPYLLKFSRDSYPDQFWMEIVAYLVGKSLKVNVPIVYPAYRTREDGTKEYGALIEWFYDKERQTFVHAADFFHLLIENFDDRLGSHHNIKDLIAICRVLSTKLSMQLNPPLLEWLGDLLLFDALIGNTDRHQENWGIIFEGGSIPNVRKLTAELSPLFDNGTSLGHERFPEQVAQWSITRLDSYIDRGYHHLRKEREKPLNRIGHIESIRNLAKLNIRPEDIAHKRMAQKINFNFILLENEIRNLCSLSASVPFSEARAEWVVRLLKRRYQRIAIMLNMRKIEKIREPDRLWLTWQPSAGGARYLIGQLDREKDSYTLTYHNTSDDFKEAEKKGFRGYPAFNTTETKHSNVIDLFSQRLPPRKRKDFIEYLNQHLLPPTFDLSDFALLGYTGAKSPADGFCLFPDFSVINEAVEFLLEVAGTRYQENLSLENVNIGDRVKLVFEPKNIHDSHAIAVIHESGKLGYVNKILCQTLSNKIKKDKVRAFVAKKNGTNERPLIYLLMEIEP